MTTGGNDTITAGDHARIRAGVDDDGQPTASTGQAQITTGAHSEVAVGNEAGSITVGEKSDVRVGGGSVSIQTGDGSKFWLGSGSDTVAIGSNNDLCLGQGYDTVSIGLNPGSTAIGHDVIDNFNVARDQINFNAALFANFCAVMANASQVGHDTIIKYDSHNSVTLEGVAVSSLSASNFHFT